LVLFWEVGGDVVNWATTKRGEVSWEVRSEEWRERWWWYRWWVVDVIVHMVVVMGTGNLCLSQSQKLMLLWLVVALVDCVVEHCWQDTRKMCWLWKAHSFDIKGYNFDSGPSLFSGLQSRGPQANPLAQVLDALGESLPYLKDNSCRA